MVKTPKKGRLRQESSQSKLIKAVLSATDSFVQGVSTIPRVCFGPDLRDQKGSAVDESVILHRILSKYEIPSANNSSDRRLSSIRKCIAYDEEGLTSFKISELPDVNRELFWKARFECHKTFRGFKPTYRFVPPTGESALSSKGEGTDIAQKLSDLRHWEVSPDALPYATRIVFHNYYLKRLVKKLFREHCESRLGQPWRLMVAKWFSESKGNPGLYVVGKMFASLCTLNAVSRMTTVPKNNADDRVITCEPFWNMVCQLSLMSDIRDIMKRVHGLDLTKRESIHRMMIKFREIATIDLKNASNSVWMCVVRSFFTGGLLRLLEQLRTPHTSYQDGGTQYHHFNMFSPMGCGLTFDVMTMLLWFHTQQLDITSSVYGDDIVIRQDKAEFLIGHLELLGMRVNESKTFLHGSISESCGAFYNHDARRYIHSFEIRRPKTLLDCIVLTNKVGSILYHSVMGTELRERFFKLHQYLVSLFPPYVVRSRRELFARYSPTHIYDDIVLVYHDCQEPDRRQTSCVYSRAMTKDLQRAVTLVRANHVRGIRVKQPLNTTAVETAWMYVRREYYPTNGTSTFKAPHDLATGSITNNYLFASILA